MSCGPRQLVLRQCNGCGNTFMTRGTHHMIREEAHRVKGIQPAMKRRCGTLSIVVPSERRNIKPLRCSTVDQPLE